MKSTAVILGFALLAAAASPAAANTRTAKPEASSESAGATAGAATQRTATAKPVCRRLVSTGSRVSGEKVCLTAQEWRVVDGGGTITAARRVR